MGWTGYTLRISATVDAHAGEKQRQGEAAFQQFMAELEQLCADPRFNTDAITVTF